MVRLDPQRRAEVGVAGSGRLPSGRSTSWRRTWPRRTASPTALSTSGAIGGAANSQTLRIHLLSNRAFTGGLAASAAFFGGIASFFLPLSVYLQEGTGRSALATGLVTLPYATGSLVTSGLGVRWAARHGRRLLVVGSLVIAVGHAALWWVVDQADRPTWWQVGGPLLLGGLGLGLAAPPLVGVVLAAVPGRLAGAAGGVLSTVNQVAGAVGVAALGALFFTRSAGGQVGDAFATVLPWQVALSLVAALLMTLLPAGSGPSRAPAP